MEVWYTPERIALHKEIDERRVARYERRAARKARQERQERVFRAVKTVLAYLFAGALWASM